MTERRGSYRVLLVEDDAGIRTLVTQALLPFGVTVHSVKDGRDALPAALDHQPHLVLLDIALPGMDGWEVLAELRALEDTVQVPVMIITAHGRSDWQALSLLRGADVFLEKPFRVAAFRDEAMALLENGRAAAGSN